jgi:hypothetical protein
VCEKTVFLSTIKVIRRSRILQWRQVGLSTEVLGESVECLLGVCRTLLEVCWRVGLDDEGWGAWGLKTYEHTKGFYRLFCVDQNLVPHPSLFGRVTQSASGIEVALVPNGSNKKLAGSACSGGRRLTESASAIEVAVDLNGSNKTLAGSGCSGWAAVDGKRFSD